MINIWWATVIIIIIIIIFSHQRSYIVYYVVCWRIHRHVFPITTLIIIQSLNYRTWTKLFLIIRQIQVDDWSEVDLRVRRPMAASCTGFTLSLTNSEGGCLLLFLFLLYDIRTNNIFIYRSSWAGENCKLT